MNEKYTKVFIEEVNIDAVQAAAYKANALTKKVNEVYLKHERGMTDQEMADYRRTIFKKLINEANLGSVNLNLD